LQELGSPRESGAGRQSSGSPLLPLKVYPKEECCGHRLDPALDQKKLERTLV
jgi:hypothetical protein